MFALGLGGRGFDSQPNMGRDQPHGMVDCQSSCQVVKHLTLKVRNRSGTPRFRIKGQGHPDITNKVEKDVKLKQTKAKQYVKYNPQRCVRLSLNNTHLVSPFTIHLFMAF